MQESAAEPNLPPVVSSTLDDFVQAARSAFGEDLVSIVLYGSAAEGRLRNTSDVNMLLLLSRFERQKADLLHEPLRIAHAAIQLTAMFVLQSEMGAALESFAVKFADIRNRHRILYGEDPFTGVSIPRTLSIARLTQTLLNLQLRMRNLYVMRGLREEQLAIVVAEVAGPLRACASTLLELEGKPAPSPKEALQQIAEGLAGADWEKVLATMTEAREKRLLAPGVSGAVLFRLMELAETMRNRAATLK